MGIKDLIVIISCYFDLKKLKVDEDMINKILLNKNFNSLYREYIDPFKKYLNSYNGYKGKLENNVKDSHLKAVYVLSIDSNSDKYISYLNDYHLFYSAIKNYYVFNDVNIDKLLLTFGSDIFDEKMSEIIKLGKSNRLIQLKEKLRYISNDKIYQLTMDDKIWNQVEIYLKKDNEWFNNLISNNPEKLIDLINNNLIEGIQYTYDNVPESHSYINKIFVINGTFNQFSMDFINQIGIEYIKKLYKYHYFESNQSSKLLFAIAKCGNYELIQDVLNYNPAGLYWNDNFGELPNNINKNIFETSYGNNKEIFLNKYLGIERNDIYYIKLFIEAIEQVKNLPKEFIEKYDYIHRLINKVYNSSNEEIIQLSEIMDISKKDYYKKLIFSWEEEGNIVIKHEFSKQLQNQKNKTINNAIHKQIKCDDNHNINVYEFNGKPFVMLVHSISSNNNIGFHNKQANSIIQNVQNWNDIKDGNNFISTSVINEKYYRTYGIPNNDDIIMFGFDDVPGENIKIMNMVDAGTNTKLESNINFNMRQGLYISDYNTVLTLDDFSKKMIDYNLHHRKNNRMWTEILLSRINQQNESKLAPSYIVCMDKISNISLKAAKFFNIPIYYIHREAYPELPYIPRNSNENIEYDDELVIQEQSPIVSK